MRRPENALFATWPQPVRLHQITTPEQVHFHYQVAGLTTRAMAWALDQLILVVVFVAIAATAAGLGASLGTAVILAAKFLLDFGYWIYFEMRMTGQSPGKRAVGIRVISSRGGKLLFVDVLVRTLFRIIDNPALIPFLGFIGAIIALIDPLHRRLGDLAADTIVVRDIRTSLPKAMLTQQSRANSFQTDPAVYNRILSRITRQERDLMLDLMVRRDGLEPTTREALFHDAAAYFRKRYNLPGHLDYLSDEQTVLNLALVVQNTKITA